MYPSDLIGRGGMPTAIRANRNAADVELDVIQRHVEKHRQESVGASLIRLPER